MNINQGGGISKNIILRKNESKLLNFNKTSQSVLLTISLILSGCGGGTKGPSIEEVQGAELKTLVFTDQGIQACISKHLGDEMGKYYPADRVKELKRINCTPDEIGEEFSVESLDDLKILELEELNVSNQKLLGIANLQDTDLQIFKSNSAESLEFFIPSGELIELELNNTKIKLSELVNQHKEGNMPNLSILKFSGNYVTQSDLDYFKVLLGGNFLYSETKVYNTITFFNEIEGELEGKLSFEILEYIKELYIGEYSREINEKLHVLDFSDYSEIKTISTEEINILSSYFPNIAYINFGLMKLPEILNISSFKKLEKLLVAKTGIEEIIFDNPILKTIDVGGNNLTQLDLSKTSVIDLSAYNNNELNSIIESKMNGISLEKINLINTKVNNYNWISNPSKLMVNNSFISGIKYILQSDFNKIGHAVNQEDIVKTLKNIFNSLTKIPENVFADINLQIIFEEEFPDIKYYEEIGIRPDTTRTLNFSKYKFDEYNLGDAIIIDGIGIENFTELSEITLNNTSSSSYLFLLMLPKLKKIYVRNVDIDCDILYELEQKGVTIEKKDNDECLLKKTIISDQNLFENQDLNNFIINKKYELEQSGKIAIYENITSLNFKDLEIDIMSQNDFELIEEYFSHIDVINFSGIVLPTSINLKSFTNITSVNLSNTGISTLIIDNSRLNNLDVQSNNLLYLDISKSIIETLKISDNNNFKKLVSSKQLLHIFANSTLFRIDDLVELNIETININKTNVSEIDLTNFSTIKILSAKSNKISKFIPGNNLLTEVNLDDNRSLTNIYTILTSYTVSSEVLKLLGLSNNFHISCDQIEEAKKGIETVIEPTLCSI